MGCTADLCDFADRLDDACYVGDMVDDDQACIGQLDRPAYRFGRDEITAVGPDYLPCDDAPADLREQGPQHRVVLPDGRHHVTPVSDHTIQRKIERIGAVIAENDAEWIRDVKEIG